MKIDERLNIGAKSIESIYDLYINELLMVNRNYQRKLVWTLEEKIKFIDSISKRYPIPLFLVAENYYNDIKRYEIIDGMQRLNAIISFIEGDFHYYGRYFDLDTTAMTKLLKDKGILNQKLPKLEREKCIQIVGYEIPLSITRKETEGIIEDIFRRINSNGKHLSRQEIRQAGVINQFSVLVRHIAESIRGDVSHSDVLELSKMKKISLNNNGLDYGIKIDDIFWCQNSIITTDNIRESRDEEEIAYIIISMITDNQLDFTAKVLDSIYNYPNTSEAKLVKEQMQKIGSDNIKEMFGVVFSEIKEILDISKHSFGDLFFRGRKHYVNIAYIVTFSAFYKLIYKDNLQIGNKWNLIKELNGLGSSEFNRNKLESIREDKNTRIRTINSIYGILKKYFIPKKDKDPALMNGIIKIDNLITKSKTENNNYDFKIGLLTMHENKFNNDSDYKDNIKEVIKTLTAICNRGKDEIGYVLIGIAETKKDAERYESFYQAKAKKAQNFYICGIEDEAKKKFKNRGKYLEKYRSEFITVLNNIKVEPETYKSFISENIELISYYDKSLLILKIKGLDMPARFNGRYYVRKNTNTTLVNGQAEEMHLYKRF